MHDHQSNVHGAPNARAWTQIVIRYREPTRGRSMLELAITAGPLVLLEIKP